MQKLELRIVLVMGEGKMAQYANVEIDRRDLDLSLEEFSARILVPAWAVILNNAREEYAKEN